MHYLEVLVADSSFKGVKALTYSYFEPLPAGTIVSVPLKIKHVLGVVLQSAAKPSFATKPLSRPEGRLRPLPGQLLELARWLSGFYPAGIGVTLQQFLPSRLYKPGDLVSLPAPLQDPVLPAAPAATRAALPPLTAEQTQAVQKMSAPGTFLLHGETGSGKTRVYIELAARALARKKSAIVLTPEIGLTPQLTRNFVEAFGPERIVTTHSKLTAKERNLAWLGILQSLEPLIVLGPRSALFAPLRDVGVIILDESHESSYKQEQAPHYHAAKVAATLANLHGATLVLGSATPSISDYYLAQAKNKPVIRMNKKAIGTSLGASGAASSSPKPGTTGQNAGAPEHTRIQLIDLKDRRHFSRQPHLANALLDSIATSLQRGEQSLVFLNRRGTARIILCQSCGWQASCPHCDLPLTYHGDTHLVRCHTCGFGRAAPHNCQECGNADIILKSIGTKAIVEELQHAFPQARIQRFDTDNTKDERLELHYEAVRAGQVDIIVGTQLVAKGLDLPNLTTVGVVVADTSLYLPDYTASERTYQLLRQVIGRVGRGHIAGSSTVVVQTYEPESPVIKAAIAGDWDGFYQAEIAERRSFLFPPFCHTLKIWCRRASSKSAQSAAEKTVASLRRSGLRLLIDGPSPAFYEKTAGKYQWQAVIKAKDRQELVKAIGLLPTNWSYDIDPNNLL